MYQLRSTVVGGALRRCCQAAPLIPTRTYAMRSTAWNGLSSMRGNGSLLSRASSMERNMFVASITVPGGLAAKRWASTGPTGSDLSSGDAVPTLVDTSSTSVDVIESTTGIGYPTDWLADLLGAAHTFTGMPWWATIIGTTLVLRTIMLPLNARVAANARKLMVVQPQVQDLMKEQRERMYSGDLSAEEKKAMQLKVYKLYEKHDCNPMKSIGFMIVQAPLFITMFMTLRRLSEWHPDASTGGIGAVVDLTMMDPYYILPTISAMTMLFTIELNAEMGGVRGATSKIMLNFMRLLCLGGFLVGSTLPAASHMYWIPNNMMSLVWATSLNRSKSFRKFFNIPEVPPHMRAELRNNAPSFKEMISDMKKMVDKAKSQAEARAAGEVEVFKTNPKLNKKSKK